MAAEGMRFEHCYSQPLCTPSRVQIMTGHYNVRNYIRFGMMDRKLTTFAHLMKRGGYKTCIVGKWQLGQELDSPQHFGFNESCLFHQTSDSHEYSNPVLTINAKEVDYNEGEYRPDLCCNYACDFIRANKQSPFLLYYPMILTHYPFEPTPDSADYDPTLKRAAPGRPKGNAKYFGEMVAYMDKLVGRIVTTLDEAGLRENTILLFTGDNGTDRLVTSKMGGRTINGGKASMADSGTRVPLIASWPGTIPAAAVTRNLVDFTDFLPTMCEAARVSLPKDLIIDGQSFLPQLCGKTGQPRAWTYCWYPFRGDTKNPQIFARNRRYKLFNDGRFLDMKDGYDPRALKVNTLSPAERIAHEMLLGVLNKYSVARPSNLAQ
jgi:arylsulfatase A